jgi:hypothetical protein
MANRFFRVIDLADHFSQTLDFHACAFEVKASVFIGMQLSFNELTRAGDEIAVTPWACIVWRA